MTTSSRYDKEQRRFLAETLYRDVFSAFDAALRMRRDEDHLERQTICDRLGKDKTGFSKLVKEHANWTLRTMSDYANALDLDIVIVLLDRRVEKRAFCKTGVATNFADKVEFSGFAQKDRVIENPPNKSFGIGNTFGNLPITGLRKKPEVKSR